jgi:hypothetical protein
MATNSGTTDARTKVQVTSLLKRTNLNFRSLNCELAKYQARSLLSDNNLFPESESRIAAVKPKEVKIISSVDKLVTGNALEVVCQTSGSSPSPRILWVLARRVDMLHHVNISQALLSPTDFKLWLPEGARYLQEVGSSSSDNAQVFTSFLSFRPKIDDHQRFLFCLSTNPLFAHQNHYIHDHIRLDIECKYTL